MRAALLVLVAGLTVPSPRTRADELPGGRAQEPGKGEKRETAPKVVVTSPLVTDVAVTQPYPGQIRARRHIEVRALADGPLSEITVREGQAVKQGEVLFKVVPVLQKAKFDAELAEARFAELELKNTKELHDKGVISAKELALSEARLEKARARVKLAEAELLFTEVRAPFDGLLDRFIEQQGSVVKKGDPLTTLSDTSVMWVYFHVPESRYLEYRAAQGKGKDPSRLELADARVELVLANGSKFGQTAGNVVTVEGTFNNETGTIAFRADFPNPDLLLRHGQTGTVAIHRKVKNATVIPQRAAFEVLDRRYVWVVDKDGVVRQRSITAEYELDDIFVVGKGLDPKDRIVLEGVRQVRDGEKVEYEFLKPEDVLGGLKRQAE